jgi:cellulose synthase/poly-beta-1,6-N-acetylglucosamine synthase-like glycosyltransferase
MWVFYFFAAIVVFLGVTSLLSGFRFAAYVRKQLHQAKPEFAPFLSVIAPCRGLEPGLRENLTALLQQKYPSYEVIFVAGDAGDSAWPLINELSEQSKSNPRIATLQVVAGHAVDSGQKVHNLRIAAGKTDQRSEVFVFVDSDARPNANWLGSLVAPLHDEGVGATTGYRWFVSAKGGLAAHLRSVWNASIASALGADGQKNFCWGGSTAIRRGTFENLNVSERWRGSVSDDFTLMRTLREARLPIQFVPACLVASVGGCTFRELFEFTTRQLKITRVYASHFWRSVLLGSLLFTLVFFGGLALVAVRTVLGLPVAWPLVLLAIIFILGAAKGVIRLQVVAYVLPECQANSPGSLLAHLFLWPVTAVLYLYNAVAAAFSRRIKWRGITYELKSPTEAVIIARESHEP